MADVSHELGSIRHIVDTPLSSKVAMFNKVANQHSASQLLNPFANVDGRASPKPSFSKDEYGKPIAGSLTEMRGQKANIHVCKEMLELCQIIDSEGFPDQENPDLRIIFFGDLFNIYNYISDKVVGLLLRARKHKLVDFEGEILFQRRDDEVPIFLLKPIREIREILQAKQEEFRRSVSPAPQPTTVIQDRLKRVTSPRSAPTSKAASPQPEVPKLSGTSSVTSLNVKPPTGHQIVTKSSDSINNVRMPEQNRTTDQKNDSVTRNDTKSTEIINGVIKSAENTTSEHKIDTTLANVIVSSEKIIKDITTSPINITVSETKSEDILNILQIAEPKLNIPEIVEPKLNMEEISETKINIQKNSEPKLNIQEIAGSVNVPTTETLVENLKNEQVTEIKPQQFLNGQLDLEMSPVSTVGLPSTVNSQESNNLVEAENIKKEIKSQYENQSQSELPISNGICTRIVDNNTALSLINAAPQ